MSHLKLGQGIEALEAIWEGVRIANGYMSPSMAPWALRKTDPARADARGIRHA